jgi:hypothetical protein
MRTGCDPACPARWSSSDSSRSGLPSTRYIVCSGPVGESEHAAIRSDVQRLNAAASSVKPSRISAYTVNAASRIHTYR